MTQPLTPQQIANAKQAATEAMESKTFVIEWRSSFVLQLIATFEARDAAFNAMLAALKSTKECMEDGYECDAYPEICSAIAHAEKVKL